MPWTPSVSGFACRFLASESFLIHRDCLPRLLEEMPNSFKLGDLMATEVGERIAVKTGNATSMNGDVEEEERRRPPLKWMKDDDGVLQAAPSKKFTKLDKDNDEEEKGDPHPNAVPGHYEGSAEGKGTLLPCPGFGDTKGKCNNRCPAGWLCPACTSVNFNDPSGSMERFNTVAFV